jgi:hypothetical protein
MMYRKKSLWMLSLLVLLTACGSSQEGTAQEATQVETEEETIEIQEEVSTDDTEDSDKDTESVSEATDEVQAEETTPAEAEADSEFQWLYDELNGKSFIFSSGAGAWRTSFSFLDNGEFSGVYSDANGPEVMVSEFTGSFDIQEEIDEFTYLLNLTNFQVISETGKEEVYGDMSITYVDEPHGFQSGSSEFELYLPYKPKDQVSEEYLSWVYGQANNEHEFLNSFGLYNVNHQFGMEELFD